MKLTEDEALKKGVKAHRAGQTQEAERLYSFVLNTQPKHPDANHNMGVLAVSLGKVQEALPFFQTTLEANPSIGDYWSSYIDALIQLDQIVDAQTALDQAKGKGVSGVAFEQLEQRVNELNKTQVKADPDMGIQNQVRPNILDSLKLEQALRLAKKKVKEESPWDANRIYDDILARFPKNKKAIDGIKSLSDGFISKVSKVQDPSQDQIQLLINLYQQGQLQQALDRTKQLLSQFPNSLNLYNIQGAANAGLGQFDSAIVSYKQAIKIKPDFADAYNNMGIAFNEMGDLNAAIDSYKQALKIKPDSAQVYYNMGITLEKQDKLEEAIDLYKSALCQLPKAYEHPHAFYRGQIHQKIWDFDGSSVSNKPYFSQSGQDKIIYEVFFKDYTTGFFLEIGAYDGIDGSNCLFFEKFKNWDGIAIEASETQFIKLEKNRSCNTLKAVIGERVEEVEFVEVTQGLTQMSGINYENYSRSLAIFDSNEKTQIEKRTVITKTVDSILREEIVVDFMSIDIEGNEMGVLNSIDFEKYEFRVICLENNIPETQNFNEFLSKKGFCFFDRVGVDEIYYNKQYFDAFK